ncbi:vWA domain-containing protein [Hymenobacter sp. YC55]|uniref:vWA domain-containing protein n=1 Tax=Hymenobacter sp. YC55 TaxID=3034019 RepID=UPI0023F9EF2A|nr:vWA domain-containing protein [Hymenobacter sp. YC55]MDF7813194.1 VWA domain-containing protein [Hymenobacter sp. YC55]
MKKLLLSFLLLPLLQGCADADDSSGSSSSGYSLTDAGPSGRVGSGGSGSSNNPSGSSQAGVITAGEWNDLRNWGFWLDVLKRPTWTALPAQWQLYSTERYTLTLTNTAGQPLAGARVTIGANPASTGVTAGVTDRLGRVELFPTLFQAAAASTSLPVQVNYHGQVFTPAPVPATEHQATRVVAASPTVSTPVDIMFVVDATGSMGDEINYLKTELRDVVTRAEAQVPAADLRLASVFYRDKGDEYVTRALPFTQNVNQLLTFVQAQGPGGGGDFPEAVDEALSVALQQQWSTEARCRLLFLVLDAPPHDEDRTRIQELTRTAARQGIRLIPITASGIDTSTEFLMRTLALSTGGTYVFITNHSGIGNTHLEASVGDYQVEYLNNLLVRLITEYSKS